MQNLFDSVSSTHANVQQAFAYQQLLSSEHIYILDTFKIVQSQKLQIWSSHS